MRKPSSYNRYWRLGKIAAFFSLILICSIHLSGCGGTDGYSTESLFSDQISTVCLEMFDNRSFRRGIEFELSDALSKRIEADTPYKIVSDKNKADTIISGQIVRAREFIPVRERQTGQALEKEIHLRVVVNWKNLKTGELLVDNASVSASASFSQWQNQGFAYGSTLAANKIARQIVELMEERW